MSRTYKSVTLATAAVALLTGLAAEPGYAQTHAGASTSDAAGRWSGAIEGPNRAIAIAVALELEGDDWSGTITIPAAGVSGLTLSDIAVDACAAEERGNAVDDVCVAFSVTGLPGPPRFTGSMSDSGRTLAGTFREGAEVLPFTLRRDDGSDGASSAGTPGAPGAPGARSTVPDRPQDPKPPLPYEVRDVTFRNDVANLRLAGTLVLPPGEGPFPAVVFASGSGPQDRDETFAGHRPFLVLADALARRGIASLRHDDRSVGGSEGVLSDATHEDLAGDIMAAVTFLAAEPRVSPHAIGVIGHSEGGLTAPRAAAADERIAFLVLLAPPGERLDELSLRQNRAMLLARGIAEPLADRVIAALRDDYVHVKDASLDTRALHALLRTRMQARRDAYSPAERDALQLNDATLQILLDQATSPWFRSLMREDPAAHLRSLRVPVLALFGAKDVQVPAAVNAPIVARALTDSPSDDVEVHTLQGLNHLLQPAETGAMDEYYHIDVTVAPEVLERIGDWITTRFARRR